MSPFKVLYGREAPTLTRYLVDSKDPPEVQQQLSQRDLLLSQLRDNLNKAQQKMKHYADKKRRDLSFAVGDAVLVKLQPYRQHSAVLRKNNKLSMRYFGPFKVGARESRNRGIQIGASCYCEKMIFSSTMNN